jgi:hypothetical protein
LFVDEVEVDDHGDVFVDWPVVVALVGQFELRYLLLLGVVDEVHQTYYG